MKFDPITKMIMDANGDRSALTQEQQDERRRIDALSVTARNERALRAGEPPYGGYDDDHEPPERFDEHTGPMD